MAIPSTRKRPDPDLSQLIRYCDQQPRPGQRVFYFCAEIGMHFGVYEGDTWFGGECGDIDRDVTHWAPESTAFPAEILCRYCAPSERLSEDNNVD
ncbi:hypothetical protein [Ferrimonas marina]|uniref:Uncharacterized protein n=1 Tax=Ferrimonas marina TaxID=299255 RepID=A0A1M5U4P7_9GAMM|nr:hypothetical protein [Ferrimonas marina]SHH57934.1 hypothetical protein SAMN02745129_2407 [Ferrimonas marina]